MKAVLDHVGIAVANLPSALAFYRDALGLEVEAPEEVASQRVRAHFIPVGESNLELLEATAPDSAIARSIEKRGPGLHHITLRVDDIAAALEQLKARGVRLVDQSPRPGAEGALVAFIHPSSAHGVLVELKQAAAGISAIPNKSAVPNLQSAISRFVVGELELISLYDGFFRQDAGSMFGVVPKAEWQRRVAVDDRNRITLAMRPLVVRGMRTMLIDAGIGDKQSAAFLDAHSVDRTRNLAHALAEAGLRVSDIDIVLATHLHFAHAGGFTYRDGSGRIRPTFPRARYVMRRGEWEEANRPNPRTASYLADDFRPLADAGVIELVDQDQTIMPGVRVQRTGGHTPHHQLVWIDSQGRRAAYVGDLIPTAAHAPDRWVAAFDDDPGATMTAKQAFVREAIARNMLVFLPHDPQIAAGRLVDDNGTPRLTPA
jgi:methylmalonyl-CoA epimerase